MPHFTLLPSPEEDGFGAKELLTVLKTSYINYLAIAIGVFMVIVYWGQSNVQFGNLDHIIFLFLLILLLELKI